MCIYIDGNHLWHAAKTLVWTEIDFVLKWSFKVVGFPPFLRHLLRWAPELCVEGKAADITEAANFTIWWSASMMTNSPASTAQQRGFTKWHSWKWELLNQSLSPLAHSLYSLWTQHASVFSAGIFMKNSPPPPPGSVDVALVSLTRVSLHTVTCWMKLQVQHSTLVTTAVRGETDFQTGVTP